MFKQKLAKSKPTKEERKEVTHESTQSKNQQKPDEGTKIKISTPNLNRAKRQTLSAKPKKVK